MTGQDRPFAARARELCTEDHSKVWFCQTCRMLEQRLTPVSELLADVLADADLTIEYLRRPVPGAPWLIHTSQTDDEDWAEALKSGPGQLMVIPSDDLAPPPSIAQAARNALTAAGWPRTALPEHLKAADAYIEELAQAYDGSVFGALGDVFRWTWQQIRPQPACDCPMDPHHRWNCPLTPTWAQTMRDLDCNPWTVVTGAGNRWRAERTHTAIRSLAASFDAITRDDRP